MIIFTKYPYSFIKSDSDEVCDITPNRRFEVPDWVAENERFQLAVTNNRIRVVDTQSTETLAKLRVDAKELGIPNASKKGEKKLLEEIAAVRSQQLNAGD